jgi:hypothetical protein
MRTGRDQTTPNEIDQFGLLLAARLSESTDNFSHHVSERLRAARVRAVATRQIGPVKVAPYLAVRNGALLLGNDRLGAWGRLAAAIPLMALVFGLITISIVQDNNQASELAEIDSALLTDDLPPSAYADPGFTVFLKNETGRKQ